MGKHTPDSWVSPSFKDRQARFIEANEPSSVVPLIPDQELNIAMMVNSLPFVDLRGLRRVDVAFKVDCLLGANAGTSVRIIAGKGQGILAEEVLKYLRELLRRKNSPIVSFVALVKLIS